MGNLNYARSNHGCGRVKRRGRYFLMVYGGSIDATPLSSVELLDLSSPQSNWTVSLNGLLAPVADVIGHAEAVFDTGTCQLVYVDSVSKLKYSCLGQFGWVVTNVSKLMPDGTNKFFKIDALLMTPNNG